MLSIQNCELMELRNIVKSLSEKLEQLSDKISGGILKDGSIQPSPIVKTKLTNDTSSITAIVTCLFNEERETEKQKLNVIIHNLPECNDPNPSNRKSYDISQTTSVIDKYMNTSTTITKAIRIGKKSEKPRLLKVTLNSSQEKFTVLSIALVYLRI